MDTILCKDSGHAARIAHQWLERAVQEIGARSVYLPAGNTPVPLYAFWEKTRPSFLSQLTFVQVDDILADGHRNYFKHFFLEHLPSYKDQFFWVEDGPKCADIAILGLGINGHVAFHEPGIPETMNWSCVKLDPLTCDNLGLSYGSWGITHGLGHFLSARKIAIMATGRSKTDMVQKILLSDKTIPAGWCASHKNFTLITDEAAFGALPQPSNFIQAPDLSIF